jgi:hypothetical protein
MSCDVFALCALPSSARRACGRRYRVYKRISFCWSIPGAQLHRGARRSIRAGGRLRRTLSSCLLARTSWVLNDTIGTEPKFCAYSQGSVEQLDPFSSPFSCVSLDETCRCHIAIKRQRASLGGEFVLAATSVKITKPTFDNEREGVSQPILRDAADARLALALEGYHKHRGARFCPRCSLPTPRPLCLRGRSRGGMPIANSHPGRSESWPVSARNSARVSRFRTGNGLAGEISRIPYRRICRGRLRANADPG